MDEINLRSAQIITRQLDKQILYTVKCEEVKADLSSVCICKMTVKISKRVASIVTVTKEDDSVMFW